MEKLRVSQLLEQLSQLSDDDAELFTNSLHAGIFDEWDCGLDTFFGMFGPVEFKIAAKTASSFARFIEQDGENDHSS